MDARNKLFHASSRKGRIWVVLIWVLLRVVDAVVYFQPGTSSNPRMKMFLAGDIVWTTALLVAIGYRQAWAKYAFIALVMLEFAFDVIQFAQSSGTFSAFPTGLVTDALGRGMVLLFVCRSWDITRLTSRTYE